MKPHPFLTGPAWSYRSAAFIANTLTRGGRLRPVLAALVLAVPLGSAQAQLQTAGTVYINVDATTLSGADGTAVATTANAGTLSGVFEGAGIYLTNALGVPALGFPGGSSSSGYMQLKNTTGGSLVVPPSGLVGASATCSIEVWALNPQVASDECMIAWGARNTGQNMAFEYGYGGSGGFQHNGTGNDIQWDPVLSSNGSPLNGYWHHLVYTCDGTTQRLFCDGVLVNSQSIGAYTTLQSAGIALGAQWTSTGTTISTTPGYATLALARVRVHDDVLTGSQVLNNYNFEKATFQPTPASAFLSAGPVHRYSFSEPATNDATGLTIHDSAGTAHGTVQASYSNNIPQLSGRRLQLPGGIQTQIPAYGAPFVSLPSGLVSANSSLKGGSGEISIEVWYKNNGLPYSWCRVFDVGSCGNQAAYPAGQQGLKVDGTGNYPPGYVASGYGYLDTFTFATQNGGNVDRHQLLWRNLDVLDCNGNVAATNVAVSADVQTLFSSGTDRHLVVTWKESTGQVVAYENGLPVASLTAPTNMTALNDVNVWLGRSLSGSDGTLDGEFDEVRFYSYVLSAAQVYGDYLVGPNTINTNSQPATILTQPQSQTVNQGWPVTFYVEAAGSPALSYQWNRNSSPIPGATADSYSLATAASTNNGDQYSCTVSNNTGAANLKTSSAATLTVIPNVAPSFVVLHETKDANPTAATSGQRDNYDGTVGVLFKVGSTPAMVTHLGMYDVYGDYSDGVQQPGLQRDHLISIYSGDGTALLASATVPAGTGGYLYKGHRYVALPAPLLLAANANYILQADVYNADGDMWPDGFYTSSWDPYFVGNNGPTTRLQRYGSHGSAVNGGNTPNAIYGGPNLATLPLGLPAIAAQQMGVTQYASLSATLTVTANGQAPLACQWYKVGSPDAPVSGQTGLSLTFPSVSASDQGNYYAVVTNTLGRAQSANIYLQVFSDTAVSVTQSPTNVTVLQGYSASFYVAAAGTPPIGYQWRRNGSPINGATAVSYTLAAAALTNNGDAYSCVVSNFANGAPRTAASADAILTVIPNQAPVPQTLYSVAAPGTRDNFSGTVGAIFQVGATPVKVTHLGYYCINGGLVYSHHVGLFSADGNAELAEVLVYGAGDVLYNQYAYVALTNPVTLAANTSYILAAEVYQNSGDPWPDVFQPSPWNSYFTGSSAGSTRTARYSGAGWPIPPLYNSSGDSIYGAPNMAVLPAGSPVVLMDQTSQTQYATSNAVFTAFVNGQAPVTVQWFKAGPPDTPVPGQTSSTLLLTSLKLSDAGTYYLMATNDLGTGRGPNATLTVLPAAVPDITLQPQSRSVYLHQPATFTVGASVPPLGYQWWFNDNPIANATNSAYTVVGTDATKTGPYKATLVNGFGTATSHVAMLSLIPVPAGSYADTVLKLNPLIYYRFEDLSGSLSTGVSNVLNLGNLGAAGTGLAEGSATNAPGPQPPAWLNFEPANQALALATNPLSGQLDVDVRIPALNLDPGTGPNMTLAAWINPSGQQEGYAGIIFNRGTGGASGLGIKQDNSGADMLEYHWANNYWDFNSLLYPTNYGKWAFVALVVQPNAAVFWLNDGSGMQTATNPAAHTGVSFASPSYVGWDNNDAPSIMNSRRFAGLIDEPVVFDRTLSPDEITALYHAGIGPVKLQVSQTGGKVILSWPAGVLQQADLVTGQYLDTAYTSPYTNPPSGTKFYRVRIP